MNLNKTINFIKPRSITPDHFQKALKRAFRKPLEAQDMFTDIITYRVKDHGYFVRITIIGEKEEMAILSEYLHQTSFRDDLDERYGKHCFLNFKIV